jgi:hypothetical protein
MALDLYMRTNRGNARRAAVAALDYAFSPTNDDEVS